MMMQPAWPKRRNYVPRKMDKLGLRVMPAFNLGEVFGTFRYIPHLIKSEILPVGAKMKIWKYMKMRAKSEGVEYCLPKSTYHSFRSAFGVLYDDDYNVIYDCENQVFFASVFGNISKPSWIP